VNLDRIKAIYTELEQYEIKLDPDPVSRGPRYLQGLIATCRNHLNMVSRVLLEVHQEKQHLARDIRAREVAFQVSFDVLLANDERIRRLPNIEDRKSTAKVFLRDEIQGIENLKSEIQDLEFVEKAVRHRHRELSATMGEIKLQKSLIATEISTGAMYGDERETGERQYADRHGPGGISVDTLDEEELSKIFDSEPAGPEVAEPPVAPAAPPVVVQAPAPEAAAAAPASTATVNASAPTEEDVASFLGTPDTTGSVTDNFDDVFANL